MADEHNPAPLVRKLAAVMQLHLPGTAGRLAQQIRDLERVAPLFLRAGLVRKVHRPSPLTVHAAGIATETPSPHRVMGGFLYAAGAVRLDSVIRDNQVATGTQDSVCEVDDIDYEDQRLRLALISIRQAYQLADAAMRDSERRDLLILDAPLLASRSMVAPRDDAVHHGHRRAYAETLEAIESFWTEHRDRMRPWNPQGTAVVGVSGGRFGAILQIAQHDLRTRRGRTFLLPGEQVDSEALQTIENTEQAILSIGERRFVQGLLGPFTRSAAYRLEATSPRMEPGYLADEGIVGFHYKGSEGTSVRFAHFLGPAERWDSKSLDLVAGVLMATSAIGGHRAEPLPLMLARRELSPLSGFLEDFARKVRHHLQSRELEAAWLTNLNELD